VKDPAFDMVHGEEALFTGGYKRILIDAGHFPQREQPNEVSPSCAWLQGTNGSQASADGEP
jgi:hypothetical protein